MRANNGIQSPVNQVSDFQQNITDNNNNPPLKKVIKDLMHKRGG